MKAAWRRAADSEGLNLRNRMNGSCGEQHLITHAPHSGNTSGILLRGEQELIGATSLWPVCPAVEGFRVGCSPRINGRGSTSDSQVKCRTLWGLRRGQSTLQSECRGFCVWFVSPDRSGTGKRPHLSCCQHMLTLLAWKPVSINTVYVTSVLGKKKVNIQKLQDTDSWQLSELTPNEPEFILSFFLDLSMCLMSTHRQHLC